MEPKAEKVTETLTVYQQKGVFSYGTDAVLLADYISSCVPQGAAKKICDLCSGTGIIPLLLCDRHKNFHTSGIEINPKAVALSERSAKDSGLSERFDIKCGDLKNIKSFFDSEQFDIVSCNPPYMTADCGKMCEDEDITLARHEIACTIYDVFSAAFYLLKTGSDIFVVYRTDRLSALMDAAKKNRFEIKDMCFYRMKNGSDKAEIVVVRAKKNAAEGMNVRCIDYK